MPFVFASDDSLKSVSLSLFYACESGDVSALTTLIDFGVDVNQANKVLLSLSLSLTQLKDCTDVPECSDGVGTLIWKYFEHWKSFE